jgi:hypothetical protein
MNVDAATVVEIAATAATIIRLKRTDFFISFSFWVVLIMCTFDALNHPSRKLLTNYDSGTPFGFIRFICGIDEYLCCRFKSY